MKFVLNTRVLLVVLVDPRASSGVLGAPTSSVRLRGAPGSFRELQGAAGGSRNVRRGAVAAGFVQKHVESGSRYVRRYIYIYV